MTKKQKTEIKNDIVVGFKSQTEEDIKDAMSDFDDYLNIIEK